jgi:MFS family permease
VTYRQLLRDNASFRRLWFAQVVSQLGDWFNAVAVYALLLDLTGSATLVATMMVVQLLPITVISPWAGVVVDRMSRRTVMIASDVARAALYAGLVFVRDADTIWIAFLLVGLGVAATAFFEPARSAILPDIVSRDELITANSLSAATWATMLAVGASVGGAITVWFGRDTAFVLNGASFLLSAAALWRMRVVERHQGRHASTSTDTGMVAGLLYVARRPAVAALLSVKGVWALAGGVMLLLTVFAERVFVGDAPSGTAARGIGVLFAARGIGAAGGALVVRFVQAGGADRLRRLIPVAYAGATAGYLGLAAAPSLALAAVGVVVAHVFGTVLWVSSTVLLQKAVPAEVRGRVFSLEFALHTLVSASSSFSTALALDQFGLAPRPLAAGLALVFLLPAAAWTLASRVGRGSVSSAPL